MVPSEPGSPGRLRVWWSGVSPGVDDGTVDLGHPRWIVSWELVLDGVFLQQHGDEGGGGDGDEGSYDAGEGGAE